MKRRRKDSGFAMLLVFLLAACIAITLYIEVPRVAFEAERQREMLLVDRGNQFKRAIQVFVKDRTNNPAGRYPASLDELENFNNHRYLRRRYVDPMTGKDEWRLVHINGGVLTDSVTTQAKTAANGQPAANSSTSDYLSQQAYIDGGANGAAAGGVTRALNRRPSDGAGAPGEPTNPGGPGGLPGDPNGTTANGLPSTAPGASGIPGANPSGMPPMPGAPGQPGTSSNANTNGQQQNQQPCSTYLGSCAPTTSESGQPTGLPGQQGNGGGIPGMGQAGSPGGAGFGTPGVPGSNSNNQNSAAGLINGLLTTPRPGGMPTSMPGSTIGGGIAGVASKYEAEGIMVINQRTKINEWEYIFDVTKYHAPPNPVTGAVGTPLQPMGAGNNNGSNNSNTQGTTTSNPTGSGNMTTGTTGHQ